MTGVRLIISDGKYGPAARQRRHTANPERCRLQPDPVAGIVNSETRTLKNRGELANRASLTLADNNRTSYSGLEMTGLE